MGVLGICREEDCLVRAIEQLHRTGYRNLETFSPIASEELLEGRGLGESPIRLYTLAGGVLGFLGGLTLTIWTSLNWPLIAGGKPVVSIPPFMVVVFELTVLIAGLSTLLGLLMHSGLGRPRTTTFPESTPFTIEWFGIYVSCEERQLKEVKQLLFVAGVEELSVQAD